MQPKPAHLGEAYASQFSDPSVVAAYRYRPPYPDAVFPLLISLIAAPPGAVLDLGCGTGDIARRLAPLVARLDAVDISAPMLALGKSLPGGDHPRLRWIAGKAEEVALVPPYALVTAGESIHWLDWARLFPRLRAALAPGGMIAIVERRYTPGPWDDPAMQALIDHFSTNRDYQHYDIVDEIARRGLFALRGERLTTPFAVRQPLSEYVECFHSRNGFSRERMAPDEAAAFDCALSELMLPRTSGGLLTLQVAAHLRWGEPLAP